MTTPVRFGVLLTRFVVPTVNPSNDYRIDLITPRELIGLR